MAGARTRLPVRGDALMFVPAGFVPAVAPSIMSHLNAAHRAELEAGEAQLKKIYGYRDLREVAEPGAKPRRRK